MIESATIMVCHQNASFSLVKKYQRAKIHDDPDSYKWRFGQVVVWLVMIYIYILQVRLKNEFSFLSFYMITFNNLLKNIKKTKQIKSINSVAESKKC